MIIPILVRIDADTAWLDDPQAERDPQIGRLAEEAVVELCQEALPFAKAITIVNQ